ncbi:GNAT family N-acetyltransferase [Stenotrophomonas sp. YIM B06876]|uniref:GNAT family N-acetyltransferase n=1 Tax=Stenotrophomonas sp. YIM B06876 TaxID=3060211 RepID=UPI00273976B4|nr:GNAT family N-acetyltransferase [Stenotrophomonas sp. YIM B06876]
MTNVLQARRATPAEFPQVLAMVRDFYQEDEILYDAARVEPGLHSLLQDPACGALLLLGSQDMPLAGYITLGWCFSVEQGGRFILLDELYLLPSARGRGWGRQALQLAREWASGQGASVLRLEVNHHNERAKALYLSAGFNDDSRDILTLPLTGAVRSTHS